ncbi:MAG: hypothetical protein K2F87_04685 [Muribaculaceae bacterium]|nr:hypothetical protein [Muribaculaceae bacterium]
MKKFMLCAAAVAVLGLSACSHKESKANDSDSVLVNAEEITAVTVDSINPDSAVVNVEQAVVETVTPATDSAAQK